MRYKELSDFFSKQSTRAEKGISVAKAAANFELLALNIRQLFKSELMQGLIMWRAGYSGRQLLDSAVDVIVEGAQALIELDKAAKPLLDLPLEQAQIISSFIGRSLQFDLDFVELDAPDRRLDCMLATALVSGSTGDIICSEISALSRKQFTRLAATSYRTYFDIYSRGRTSEPVEDLISVAETAYSNRSFDKFYASGLQTEGGGRENELVVDYRLGAVLDQISYAGNSIHRWRW